MYYLLKVFYLYVVKIAYTMFENKLVFLKLNYFILYNERNILQQYSLSMFSFLYVCYKSFLKVPTYIGIHIFSRIFRENEAYLNFYQFDTK